MSDLIPITIDQVTVRGVSAQKRCPIQHWHPIQTTDGVLLCTVCTDRVEAEGVYSLIVDSETFLKAGTALAVANPGK